MRNKNISCLVELAFVRETVPTIKQCTIRVVPTIYRLCRWIKGVVTRVFDERVGVVDRKCVLSLKCLYWSSFLFCCSSSSL